MGFDEGQIVLNSDNGTYFPGQMLYGRLEFDLNKDKTFRGIYAEIKGRCKVHWTTSHTRRVNDRTEHYTVSHDSHEEYMNTTIYLIGSKSGEEVLRPGHHVFPFECQIPSNAPSSFEGSEGNVRYSIKVTVDRAFKLDQEKQIGFRVDAPLDLNSIPDAKEPMAFLFEQTFCCWCMNAGLAETIIKVPASGFIPKQIIPIEVACNNNSSVEIDAIRFSLIKTITFEAQHHPDTRSSEDVIAKIKKGPIPGNTERNYTVEMEVPDMDVPNMNPCRFITICFRFKVELETSGCHVDENEEQRIFIGSIPLGSLQYPPNSNFQTADNPQGVNAYPPPAVHQPLTNGAPYPVTNAPYPGSNQPLPDGNPPYPGGNPPYPGGNPPYPGGNPPYPSNKPNIGFTAENPPYPTASPYPAPSPYPVGSNPPYPGGNAGVNPPYPTPGITSPYPPNVGPNTSPYPAANPGPGLKTGSLGFYESMPLLPPGVTPLPSGFAGASAPPETPGDENKKMTGDIPPYPPQ